MPIARQSQFGLGIAVVGLNETQAALRSLAPELAREMDREIRGALEPIAARGRANIPDVALSGWGQGRGEWGGRLGWDAGQVRGGIKVRKGGSRTREMRAQRVSVGYRITNETAAGAVFEVAGRRSAGSNAQGRAFITNLTRGHGAASRGIWDAWDSTSGKALIEQRIRAAVETAERHLNRVTEQTAAGG